MLPITRLILQNMGVDPPVGDKKGRCVFCGRVVQNGFGVEFPNTFVSFDRVYSGTVICPYCYYIFKHAEFRRNSWLVTESSFRFLDNKDEVLKVLLDPPKEPWMMYITRSRRKHGWINLVEKINLSRDSYIVGFDEATIYIKKKELKELYGCVKKLVELKIPKSEIWRGSFSVRSVAKADRETIEKVIGYSRSPLLDLVLFLVRR